jgi:hypothetical protein
MPRKKNINTSAPNTIWLEELAKLVSPENWKELGATGEPTLQNSWTITTNYHFGFRHLLCINAVHLHGRLTPGTEAAGTLIFTLPTGYQPLKALSYSVVTDVAGAAGSRFNIATDGQVTIESADIAGTFYDINIIFPLD